ncbi:MAG TPA: hypothetical protein VGR73_04370 [Bryobacteraceae bacterium]|nr:hypothetical protein [Bryobacteraceae bacterium]
MNGTDATGLRRDDAYGDDGCDAFSDDGGCDPSFGGGAYSIAIDWTNIARGNCDDGQWKTSFAGIGPCIAAGVAALAAQASNPPPPPCWDNLANIHDTLTELGQNIEEIAATVIGNTAELAKLANAIGGDITQEMIQIGGMVSGGGPPTGPDFVGGHFNLLIPTAQITAALGGDFGAFQSALGGKIDGTRQDAVYGNAAQGNYTLHSKQHGGNGGYFNAHFDIYNPGSDVVSAIKHLFGDVIGGHNGSPCLDPAWQ